MSKLSSILRSVTGGHWFGKSTQPRFSKYRKLGHSADNRPDGSVARTHVDLAIEQFRTAPMFENRIEHLHHSFGLIPAEGHIIECGVHRGGSINWLGKWASGRKDRQVFGFDSFEGLPHEWVKTKSGIRYDAGHFALPALPAVVENVSLIPGWFDATFTPWLNEHPGPIALLHNDSDLYSSTAYTLKTFNHRLRPGSIIVFDELCDWKDSGVYDAWEEGEWLALREWMQEFDRKVRVLSRDAAFSAAVQIVQ